MFTLNIGNKEFYNFIMGINAHIMLDIANHNAENPDSPADDDFYTKVLTKHVERIISPHGCDEEVKILICQLIGEFLTFVGSINICLAQFKAEIVQKEIEKKLGERNVSTARN